ncbi:MAG: hypothetical protein ACXABO_14625 [Promethearchaeota archaeon]
MTDFHDYSIFGQKVCFTIQNPSQSIPITFLRLNGIKRDRTWEKPSSG